MSVLENLNVNVFDKSAEILQQLFYFQILAELDTASKVLVFGVFPVRIFQHLD